MSTKKRANLKLKENHKPDKNVFGQVPVKFLLEHLNNAFTIFDDKRQKFVYANPQFLYFAGLKEDEANSLEEEFFKHVHPQDLILLGNDVQQRIDEVCKKYISNKNKQLTYSITLRLRNNSGGFEHVMIQTTVLEWEGKNERRTGLNIYFNVNEQKKDNALVLAVNIFDENNKRWMTVVNERFCARPSRISKKECEVMKHIVAGKTAHEISEMMGLSYYTVRAHWRNILSKTDCKSQAELKELAITEGWI